MLVSNWLLDSVLFGALLVALVIDALVPATHGVMVLLVVGAITYFAAEDCSHNLRKFSLWSQESLASSVATSVAGFVYYWWRNDADIIATALHIGLMMASLMLLIGVVAAFGAAWNDRSPRPIAGLILTLAQALVLGGLAGVFIYLLTSASVALVSKLAIVLVGAGLWKIRQKFRPPVVNEALLVPPVGAASGHVGPESRLILAQQGTVLDRFVPAALVGCIALWVLEKAFGTMIR